MLCERQEHEPKANSKDLCDTTKVSKQVKQPVNPSVVVLGLSLQKDIRVKDFSRLDTWNFGALVELSYLIESVGSRDLSKLEKRVFSYDIVLSECKHVLLCHIVVQHCRIKQLHACHHRLYVVDREINTLLDHPGVNLYVFDEFIDFMILLAIWLAVLSLALLTLPN